MFRLASLIIIISIYHKIYALDFTNIVFMIVNGFDPYSMQQAEELKKLIRTQIVSVMPEGEDEEDIFIYDSTKFRNVTEDWIYIRALKYLLKEHSRTTRQWAVFLEPRTHLNYTNLLSVLKNVHKKSELKWIGHADFQDYSYGTDAFGIGYFLCPYLPSGFAIKIDYIPLKLKTRKTTVISEPGLELAKRLYVQKPAINVGLNSNPYFCGRIFNPKNCATYPTHFKPCGSAISSAFIYFAVITDKENHNTRVVTIQKTWGKDVDIGFYSDVTDPKIPTISTLNSTTNGTEETNEQDYCSKIKTILSKAVMHATKNLKIRWIFLADDETVVSVYRLRELLSCHDHDDMTVIGRVYQIVNENSGKLDTYDYLSLGGGAVFSLPAAESLSECQCYENDDRFFGKCASELEIPLVNSPLFYQEPVEFYRYREPIEFKPLSIRDDENPTKTFYKLKLGLFHPNYMPFFGSPEHQKNNKHTEIIY